MDVDDRRGGEREYSDRVDAVQHGSDSLDVSCRVLRMDGVFLRMLMPYEAEIARRATTAAEKTNEVPLRCW